MPSVNARFSGRRRSIRRASWVFALLLTSLAFAEQARAQAPINSNVALQPPKGGLILRQQFRYAEADFNRDGADLDIELWAEATTAVYGVTDSFTLLLDAPVVISQRVKNNATGASDTEAGLADWTALAKLRLFREDTGPTDTMRFDAIAGLELPTGEDAFSSDSVDPIVGGVFTMSRDRWFFDADLLWKFDTSGGLPDQMRYDAALIYRLSPVEYTRANQPAFNGLVELNGLYETNGDNELFLSPGIQYVTIRWIVEATVQIPVWQDLDGRPESDFIVGFGFRVQF